jgi:ABC-2 type transport system permease protein
MNLFFEKFWRKNYKWWYLFWFRFRSRGTYPINNLVFVFGQLIVLISSIAVWYASFNASHSLDKFEYVLNYFVVGHILYTLINVFPSWFIAPDINSGKISSVLIVPQKTLQYYLFYSYGNSFYQNLTSLTILALTSPLWWRFFILPQDFITLLLSVIAYICAFFILFFIETIIGFITFYTTETWALMTNFGSILNFFSGRLYPLDLVFSNFTLTIFNPFSFVFYQPLQIYLGKYDQQKALMAVSFGLIWVLILYKLSSILFKYGLKKYESVGL